jgi:hypothetical protein
VNTGEVVAARAATGGDFLVTGDAVNVAARLQQHAEPGSILAGERTMRAAAGFRFAEPQRIAVKGKQDPIAAAVVIERAGPSRAAPPFLGREHDLAQLELVARRAMSERRAQLVTITAPAGTGKSRLVEEFAARLGGNVTLAIAQCLPYGGAVTFLPLQGLARGLLNLGEGADPVAAIRVAFSGAGYDDAGSSRLAASIGATLGEHGESARGEAGRGDREEIFTAWRLLIEILAARRPLVVVFEDLHWASDTLLDLVEHVTISRSPAPLVMIALARSELLDRRPNWGGGRRNFTWISLEPLAHDECVRLVELLAGEEAHADAPRIVERAGGNPFFVGELVRAYRDRRAGEAGGEVRLPDTVHATVLARIDGLPANERAVLEFASVAGRTARIDEIAALLPDLGAAQIREAVAALVDFELMTPAGGSAFTFHHIVIREVAYATLPRAERARAHLRLATLLEGDGSRAAELAELVAYHYRRAVELAPAGRAPEGVSIERAMAALERAARIASSTGAFAEAADHVRAAIRIAPAPQHLRLLELLGDLMLVGDIAVGGYLDALALWRAVPGGDLAVGARLATKLVLMYGRWSGGLSQIPEKEIERLDREAAEWLARAPDEEASARLACAKAFIASTHAPVPRDEVQEILSRVEAAASFYEARGDAIGESEALDAVAAVYRANAGDYARAIEATRRRLSLEEKLSLLERIDGWAALAWDLILSGRFEDAIRVFEDARRKLRPGEPPYLLSHSAAWAAYASMHLGQWDRAIELNDFMLYVREEGRHTIGAGRFLFPGLISGLRVAAARHDSTRLARYRSMFAATADRSPGSVQGALWGAFLDNDAVQARAYAIQPQGQPYRKGDLIAFLLLDLRRELAPADIAVIEEQNPNRPALLSLRLALARALNAGPEEIRAAIRALEGASLKADAARAQMLLALRTHDAADRAAAESRLGAHGDTAGLQALREEW